MSNKNTESIIFYTSKLFMMLCNADQHDGLECMNGDTWYSMSDMKHAMIEVKLDRIDDKKLNAA